jgi:hypothetical protein
MNQPKFFTGIFIASLVMTAMDSLSIPHKLAIAAPATTSPTTQRSPFYSQAGRFSINFPSQPQASTDKVEDDITVYSFIVAGDQKLYQVGYYDVPGLSYLSREGIRKLTISLAQGFAEGFEAKITSTKNIQLGNHLGQEFKFTQSGQSGQGRAYIVKERVYLIAGMDTPKASQAFLNSFRLR